MENIYFSILGNLRIICLFASCIAFFFWYKNNFSYKGNLPVLNFYTFLFSLLWNKGLKQTISTSLQNHLLTTALDLSESYEREGLFMIDFFFRRVVLVFKAEHVKTLINQPSAQEKALEYEVIHNLGSSGLIAASSEKAQHHRKIVTPAFHTNVLKVYLEVFNEEAVSLVNKIKERVEEPWIFVEHYVKQCTLGVICQTAMGIQIASNKEATAFLNDVDAYLEFVPYRIVQPWTRNDSLYKYFPNGRKLWRHCKNIMEFTDKIILENKEAMLLHNTNKNSCVENNNNVNVRNQRKNFVKLLLETHLVDPSLTLKDIRDEVTTFILAGAETLSVAIDMIVTMLGLHQHIQETAIEELDAIFSNDPKRSASFDDIKEMKYLECVIKETLRIYPPVPLYAKEAKEKFCLGQYEIPAGTGVAVLTYTLHRDPEYFPNPEKFDPERFYPENVQNRNPYAFAPFSLGSRSCVGQKFGMIEMKCVISHILRNFRIETLDPREQLTFTWNVSMKSVTPLRVKFIPRYTS